MDPTRLGLVLLCRHNLIFSRYQLDNNYYIALSTVFGDSTLRQIFRRAEVQNDAIQRVP